MTKPWNEWTRAEKDKNNLRIRQHRSSPELRAYRREYAKAYRRANPAKLRDYLDRPEVRERRKHLRKTWLKAHPLRPRILERDGNSCAYCKMTWERYQELCPGAAWHLDHILPRALGGKDGQANRVLACSFCNYAKHNVKLDVFQAWLAYLRTSSN